MSNPTVPIIRSADDVPAAIKYAQSHPSSRFFVARQAILAGAGEQVPEDWPGAPGLTAARKPKLGTGTRFANLKTKLAKRGVNDPEALAAWIGRKKFGAKKFGKLAAKARTAAVTADAGDPPVDAPPGEVAAPSAGWLRRVRSEINEAGIDPDTVEAALPGGYVSNYDGNIDPVMFAEQLVSQFAQSLADEFPELLASPEGGPDTPDGGGEAETADGGEGDDDQAAVGDDDDDEEEPEPETAAPADPSAPPTQAQAPMPVAASTYSGQQHPLVYVNGAPQTLDMAAITAAVRTVVQEEFAALLANAMPLLDEDDPDMAGGEEPPPLALADQAAAQGVTPQAGIVNPDEEDDLTAAAPPVDLDASKAALRARFRGGTPDGPPGVDDAAPMPVPPVGKRKPIMSGAQMRERIAAASSGAGGPKAS